MKIPSTVWHLGQGRKAEHKAGVYLKKHGLALLESNYQSPYGEIDLIMQQEDVVVFVEVRYRRSNDYGTPAETVDAAKQSRLRASAQHYLQLHTNLSNRPCRFDIVGFTEKLDDNNVSWIQNAF